MPAAAAAVAALTCPAGGRGWCAAVAGILEATAAKPGNVHPGASFPDLSHADLVAAAVAIAPVLERAATAPLGRTILEAVSAARSAADTNANLGIILLTAPLAAVPDGETLSVAAVDRVFARLDAADAADVYRAISLARPGGMDRVDRDDVAGPPPTDLRAAMRAAADRDQIARLWAEGFGSLFAGAVAGALMPNLTYLLVFPDEPGRAAAWNSFRTDADWLKLKAMPEYADKEIVSRITNKLLTPTAYSEI